MKSILKNKKGQLGMDVAKGFILGLLTLLVIGVTILIVTNSLSTTDLAYDSYAVVNETGGFINTTGYTLDSASINGFKDVSITEVFNYTNRTQPAISSGNYTVTSAGVVTNASVTNYANATFSYSYEASNDIASITDNSSTGLVSFFSSTTTWLALLGVVIIILIISVVISVVNRFGRGRTI